MGSWRTVRAGKVISGKGSEIIIRDKNAKPGIKHEAAKSSG